MTIKRDVLKLAAIIIGVSLAGSLFELALNGNKELVDNLELLAELFSVFVSFSIFGMTWTTYKRSRNNHALFLGSAFLVIGFIDLFHTLSYTFMPEFITPNFPGKSAVFWSMARLISAPLFLASAYIYKDTLSALINKPVLSVSAIVISIISFIIGIFYHDYMPDAFHEEALSSVRIMQVFITAIIILYASYLYTRRIAEKNLGILLIYGFITVVFSDMIYFSYEVPAHFLKIAGFYFIYLSLYKSSVESPYEKLAIAEEKLRQATEERYRNLFDNANDAIIIHDLDGRIISWNNAAEKIFRWTAQEITGKKLVQVITPPDRRAEVERIACTIVPGGLTGFETEFLRKDGSRIIGSLTVSYLIDANQNVIGISCIIRDITEHKKAEKILKNSKEFLETVLNSMNDAISVIDVNDFKIIDVNTVFLRKYGLNKEDVIGRTCHEVTHKCAEPCTPPDDICPLVDTLSTGKHSTAEHVHYTKDGEKRYVEVATSPIKDENGKVISVIHVAKDITERKKAEELRLENERLILANRAKSEFLATMSHELRTPMNAVLGFSEILKQKIDGELNERQEHFIDNILTSGKRQLDLIEMILDMTQMEAGKLELTIGKMAVPETIDETLDPIKTTAAGRNVVIKKELDPELGFIMADRSRFKQVLSNLLDNAVKFSKPEGGTVTVTSKKEGDMAKFSVSDTGIGIKEEDMGKLFRAFQQVDMGTTRKYGGTGIGLAIAKQLVELHGGTITAKSRYGEGSTFTFSISLKTKRRRKNK